MGVGYFYGGDLSVIPAEDQSPLLTDSHAPETFEIAGKGFEPVASSIPLFDENRFFSVAERDFAGSVRKNKWN